MNLDDPKLTAFALDEVDEPERSAIARALAESPEAKRIVDETREMARALKNEFAAELEKDVILPTNLVDIRDDPWFWSVARPLAVAAVIAVCAIVAGVTVFSLKHSDVDSGEFRGARVNLPPRDRSPQVEGEIFGVDEIQNTPAAGAPPTLQAASGREDFGPTTSDQTGENPFLDGKSNPLSTFSIDVDTASYSNIRRFINQGSLPPKDAVRVEEMINYFTYDYAQPTDEKPFAVSVDLASCPWETSHRLVRIGLKGREIVTNKRALGQQMNGTLVTIAKDVKVQVEFNPARVASYRLIGYEKRMLRKEDFNNDKIDAGEIGAGHTVTALYEVVPVGASANSAVSVPPVDPLKYSPNEPTTSSTGEMLTVKLRYKKPDADKSELIERVVADDDGDFAKAAPDLKFAAAVAEFGMLLRDSEHKGNGTFGAVLEWAEEGKANDTNGYRGDFIELVRKAQMLKKG